MTETIIARLRLAADTLEADRVGLAGDPVAWSEALRTAADRAQEVADLACQLSADTLAAGAAGAAWGYLRAAHGTAGAEQRMLRARDLRELAQALYDLEWEGNDDA